MFLSVAGGKVSSWPLKEGEAPVAKIDALHDVVVCTASDLTLTAQSSSLISRSASLITGLAAAFAVTTAPLPSKPQKIALPDLLSSIP